MTKINWKKEARLLPGYLIVLVWVAFTAVMLCWIVGASLSTSREIFSGQIYLPPASTGKTTSPPGRPKTCQYSLKILCCTL